MIKIPHSKLVILLEYQYIKTFLQKTMFQIGLKVLLLQKLKILSCGQVVSDLKSEKIFGTFYEKELQKINRKEFRIEKGIKRKGDKLYVKWKT